MTNGRNGNSGDNGSNDKEQLKMTRAVMMQGRGDKGNVDSVELNERNCGFSCLAEFQRDAKHEESRLLDSAG